MSYGYTQEDINECKKILEAYESCFTNDDWSEAPKIPQRPQFNQAQPQPKLYDPMSIFDGYESTTTQSDPEYVVVTVGEGANQRHNVKNPRTNQLMGSYVLVEAANKISKYLNEGKTAYDPSIIEVVMKDQKFTNIIKEMQQVKNTSLNESVMKSKFEELKKKALETKKSI